MTVKELSQLYRLNKEIAEEEERLAELDEEIRKDTNRLIALQNRAVSPSAGSGGGIMSSGEGSALENAVLRMIETEELLKAKITERSACVAIIQGKLIECFKERTRLEKYVAGIDNSYIRSLITLRFIELLEWGEVAEKIGKPEAECAIKKMVYRFLKNQKGGECYDDGFDYFADCRNCRLNPLRKRKNK